MDESEDALGRLSSDHFERQSPSRKVHTSVEDDRLPLHFSAAKKSYCVLLTCQSCCRMETMHMTDASLQTVDCE